jgi:hypothetical protein
MERIARLELSFALDELTNAMVHRPMVRRCRLML